MLNKINPLYKIWVSHILIYFLIYSIIILTEQNTNTHTSKIVTTILGSSIIGLFGFLDGIGYLVLISIVIMYLLNSYLKKIFFSYVLSLALTYPIFIFYCNEGYGSYKITIISLLITIIINGIIFRKQIFKNKKP